MMLSEKEMASTLRLFVSGTVLLALAAAAMLIFLAVHLDYREEATRAETRCPKVTGVAGDGHAHANCGAKSPGIR